MNMYIYNRSTSTDFEVLHLAMATINVVETGVAGFLYQKV